MFNQPTVSVIIIFLNAEKFLEEAINSVFAQTYDNWELLLVDDGSADRSTEIAFSYVEQYPDKVHYLEHEEHQNRGMSATRNLGICKSRGKYIAFLDADDVWLPRNLEQYIAILNTYPEVGMCYGNTQKWYSWTGNPEDIQRDELYNLGVSFNTLIKPSILFNLLIQERISAPCTCSILVRREILEDVGGFEESFQGMYEDQAFYAKIFLKANVFVIDFCGAKYRKHPDSCVSVTRRKKQDYTARLFFLSWLEQYLLEQSVQDGQIAQVLRKELRQYRYPKFYPILGKIRNLFCMRKNVNRFNLI